MLMLFFMQSKNQAKPQLQIKAQNVRDQEFKESLALTCIQ
jgi:hypothetical protein